MLSKTRSVKKMLLRLVLFVPVLALCFYCFNQEIVAKPVVQKESPSILGKWVERKSEFAQLTIYEQDKKLWMKAYKDTFELRQESENRYAVTKKNKSSLSAGKMRAFLDYKPENNELLLNDKSFIRPENTYGKIFTGDWEGIDIDQKFYIRSENGGTSWIIEDQFGTNTYYPVLTSTGFYFTYDNRDIYFTVTGNRMTSSEGYIYKKVKEAPKVIYIDVVDNWLGINGNPSSLKGFVKDLDLNTANWSSENFKNYILKVHMREGNEEFLKELNKEFKKTDLFKINPSQQLITPPAPAAPKTETPAPPPPSPAVPKAVKSNKTLNKPVPEESEIIQVFEDIYIEIDKNHQVFINSKMIDSERIEKALSRYNSDYTKAERAKVMDVKITVDPSVKMGIITDVKSALRDYGVKSIQVIIAGESQEEALIPAGSDTKKQSTNTQNELEIRINRNDEILINGSVTALNQFSQDISEVRETLIQQETSNKIFVFIFPSPRTPDHLITYLKKELNKQNLKSLAVIHMEMPPLPKNATKEEKKQHRLACYQIYVNYMKEKYGDDVKLQPISEYPWGIKSSQ